MTTQTTSHLAQEHRAFERALDAFSAFLDRVERDPSTDPELTQRQMVWPLVDYLVDCLLLRHEEKEETIVLPEIARAGADWNDGALPHVREDHRHGRYLLRSLRYSLHQSRRWTVDERRHFLSIGREWVKFNREHMGREEAHLFPLIERFLTPARDQGVLVHLQKVDKEVEEFRGASELTAQGEALIAELLGER